MNRRMLLAVSAASLAAAVGVGTTLSAWNGSAVAGGDVVRTGAVAMTQGPVSATNVAPDVVGTADAAIGDLADYAIFPGDVIRVAQTLDVRLVGDNARAVLTPTAEVSATGAGAWVHATTSVYPGRFGAAAVPGTGALAAQADGTYLLTGATTAPYTVVTDYRFDESAPADVLADARTVVSSTSSSLAQVRATGSP